MDEFLIVFNGYILQRIKMAKKNKEKKKHRFLRFTFKTALTAGLAYGAYYAYNSFLGSKDDPWAQSYWEKTDESAN